MLRSKGKKSFSPDSLQGIFYLVRAEKIFSSNGGEMSLFFCHGAEYYGLWHGMPLKKIGFDDTLSFGQGERTFFCKKIDLLLTKIFPWTASFFSLKKLRTVTNSEFFVQFLKTAFRLDEDKIFKTGSPRCDALFFHRREKLIDEIREKFPQNKIMLFMPTFRTSAWTGEIYNPFDEKYGFDLNEFLTNLERNKIVFLYKPHYCDLCLMEKMKIGAEISRFIMIGDDDYDELYNFVGQVDVLATDYSSIYFDFVATKKPVILLPFDYEFYIKYARGHYFDYFTNVEGAKAKNWQEFCRILDENSYAAVSEKNRMKFAEYLDGNCCKKLFDEISHLPRKKIKFD